MTTYEFYQFWGILFYLWIIWIFLLIWIIFTPWGPPKEKRKKEKPLDILQERYAKREISRTEYKARQSVLKKDTETIEQ